MPPQPTGAGNVVKVKIDLDKAAEILNALEYAEPTHYPPAYERRKNAIRYMRDAIDEAAKSDEFNDYREPLDRLTKEQRRRTHLRDRTDRYFPKTDLERAMRESEGWRTREDGSMFKPGS